jgi:hypothetical protein
MRQWVKLWEMGKKRKQKEFGRRKSPLIATPNDEIRTSFKRHLRFIKTSFKCCFITVSASDSELIIWKVPNNSKCFFSYNWRRKNFKHFLKTAFRNISLNNNIGHRKRNSSNFTFLLNLQFKLIINSERFPTILFLLFISNFHKNN